METITPTIYSKESLFNPAKQSINRAIANIHEYDDRGNLSSVIFPDGYKILRKYDDQGNLISQIYPDGYKTSYRYDDQNKLISKTTSWGGSQLY